MYAGLEGSLRLTDGGDGDIQNSPADGVGILEIFHAGAWGTVCNGDPITNCIKSDSLDCADDAEYYEARLTVEDRNLTEVCCLGYAKLRNQLLLPENNTVMHGSGLAHSCHHEGA